MGLKGRKYSVAELSSAGVRRVSVGGSFARAALGALMRAAMEVKTAGTFEYADDALSAAFASQLMSREKRRTGYELGREAKVSSRDRCGSWSVCSRPSRTERHDDFFRADETIQPVTGLEFDFDVFRSFWQGIVAGSATICCVAEDGTIDHVLVAEAVQLQVHDIFEGEGDDCVLVKDAVSILINGIGANPAVYLQLADAGAIECEAQNFRVMKGRLLAEPRQQFRTSGYLLVGHLISHGRLVMAYR